MSSPIHAGTLAPLLPTTDKTPCERVQPGVINWMQAITQGYAWWFKVNGEFSAAFIAMVQALECVGGGVILPCPVVSLAGTATPGDTTMGLSFNGTRMTSGYAYSIFRSTTEGVFSDPAITTGTTSGSVINYTDAGPLVNDTEYFYKLTVQKTTCDEYSVEISGTPKLCKDLILTMSVVSDAPGHVVIVVQGNLEATYTYTLFASNLPNQIGSQVDAGDITGAHGEQINGKLALRLEQSPALTGIPGGGQTWTYTLLIREKPACMEYQMVSSVFVNDQTLDTPVLSFSDLAFRWGLVNGAARYGVFVRPIGAVRNSPVFTWKADVVGTSYPFSLTNFPCTENFDGSYFMSKWEVKIIAYGTNGVSSQFSNVVSTPEFLKFQGQCAG